MSVRATHARHQSLEVSFNHGGEFVTLHRQDTYRMPKSKLYSLKKRILEGKLILPVNELTYKSYTVEADGTLRAGYPKI